MQSGHLRSQVGAVNSRTQTEQREVASLPHLHLIPDSSLHIDHCQKEGDHGVEITSCLVVISETLHDDKEMACHDDSDSNPCM